jgi:hypothetical protein
MIKLQSIDTNKLSSNLIKKICYLKNSFWNFGISNQINWFKKNVEKNDIHNLLYYKNYLIGYSMLRNRKIIKRKKKYLQLDTVIIHKKFQNNNYSYILMNFNNLIINNNNKKTFLICKKNLVKFYKKFKWKEINKNLFKAIDCKSSYCMMTLEKYK